MIFMHIRDCTMKLYQFKTNLQHQCNSAIICIYNTIKCIHYSGTLPLSGPLKGILQTMECLLAVCKRNFNEILKFVKFDTHLLIVRNFGRFGTFIRGPTSIGFRSSVGVIYNVLFLLFWWLFFVYMNWKDDYKMMFSRFKYIQTSIASLLFDVWLYFNSKTSS